jgi:hypothetical protein
MVPPQHLLDVEPVLRSVEDRFANDQVLRAEDRDLDRAEAHQPGALGHLEVQVQRGEEDVEVRVVPVEPRLPVEGTSAEGQAGTRHGPGRRHPLRSGAGTRAPA